ncbi:MAG: nucleotide exchange factor GrpE [Oscillospiraceae bacterium]|nr:nucleotide exchange factor GrpE [Oscillospiraceae bacterium]
MNDEEISAVNNEDIENEEAEVTVEKASEENENAAEAEDKTAEELKAVKDQLLRTMAEYDNFRKRSQREKEALRAEIVTNVTSQFLPVMDNLERALAAECSDENYKNGVKMICDSFNETLKNLGVEEIKSDGEMFSPSFHQAVQKVPGGDAESGTIVQTFAKGYKIGDKVIRFAVVAVAE